MKKFTCLTLRACGLEMKKRFVFFDSPDQVKAKILGDAERSAEIMGNPENQTNDKLASLKSEALARSKALTDSLKKIPSDTSPDDKAKIEAAANEANAEAKALIEKKYGELTAALAKNAQDAAQKAGEILASQTPAAPTGNSIEVASGLEAGRKDVADQLYPNEVISDSDFAWRLNNVVHYSMKNVDGTVQNSRRDFSDTQVRNLWMRVVRKVYEDQGKEAADKILNNLKNFKKATGNSINEENLMKSPDFQFLAEAVNSQPPFMVFNRKIGDKDHALIALIYARIHAANNLIKDDAVRAVYKEYLRTEATKCANEGRSSDGILSPTDWVKANMSAHPEYARALEPMNEVKLDQERAALVESVLAGIDVSTGHPASDKKILLSAILLAALRSEPEPNNWKSTITSTLQRMGWKDADFGKLSQLDGSIGYQKQVGPYFYENLPVKDLGKLLNEQGNFKDVHTQKLAGYLAGLVDVAKVKLADKPDILQQYQKILGEKFAAMTPTGTFEEMQKLFPPVDVFLTGLKKEKVESDKEAAKKSSAATTPAGASQTPAGTPAAFAEGAPKGKKRRKRKGSTSGETIVAAGSGPSSPAGSGGASGAAKVEAAAGTPKSEVATGAPKAPDSPRRERRRKRGKSAGTDGPGQERVGRASGSKPSEETPAAAPVAAPRSPASGPKSAPASAPTEIADDGKPKITETSGKRDDWRTANPYVDYGAIDNEILTVVSKALTSKLPGGKPLSNEDVGDKSLAQGIERLKQNEEAYGDYQLDYGKKGTVSVKVSKDEVVVHHDNYKG